jgi:hypothetical protein
MQSNVVFYELIKLCKHLRVYVVIKRNITIHTYITNRTLLTKLNSGTLVRQ